MRKRSDENEQSIRKVMPDPYSPLKTCCVIYTHPREHIHNKTYTDSTYLKGNKHELWQLYLSNICQNNGLVELMLYGHVI